MTVERTPVAILGAGPAGLLLSHLLHQRGIASIVVDSRTREEIESTIRAGILEQGSVELLDGLGEHSRARTVGHRHDGIELGFGGELHRIDFAALVGRSVWLYPQHEVLKDLVAGRLADGADLRFSTLATDIEDADGDTPTLVVTGPDGEVSRITADVIVGADGSRGISRAIVTGSSRGGYAREYPFAWFGILTEAPPSAPELIYSSSPDGFALISQRSDSVQRMYFQASPEENPDDWSDEQIWDALQLRTPGAELKRGPIFQKDLLKFRSFVAHTLRRSRVLLVGDAAHTVPPTGAKGMNLAFADVSLADRAIAALLAGDARLFDEYPEKALERIWKAQNFSYWMTSMLHTTSDASDFDRRRQEGELRSIVESTAGSTYLAEAYTGWPLA